MDDEPSPVPPVSPAPPASKKRHLLAWTFGLLMLLVVAVVLLPALKSAREQARRAQCLANIKQFALAWTMYLEDEHPEQFRTLDDLKPYAKDLKIFVCPSAKDQLHTSYEIVGITNLWQDNPDAVVIREIEPNHAGGRNVLYNDGHAQWQPDRL